MKAEITMRELIILALCFLLYVVAVEVYEARVEVSRQGELARQEHSFVYVPASPPVSRDGQTIVLEER